MIDAVDEELELELDDDRLLVSGITVRVTAIGIVAEIGDDAASLVGWSNELNARVRPKGEPPGDEAAGDR